MKSSPACLGVCLFLAAAGASVAQAPAQADAAPTVRATTSEVLLDLTVRDKKGKQAKNLKAEEVEIYEDGVRQEILSFRPAGIRESQRKSEGVQGKEQAPRSSRPLRAVNLVCIVFNNLDPLSRTRAIAAIQEFLKSDFSTDTYFGLFVLDDRLKPVYPFTNNRQELARAVQGAFGGRVLDFNMAAEPVLTANPNQMTVSAIVTGRSATVTAKLSGGEVARTAITGADVSTGAGANALRGDKVREREDFGNVTGMRATDSINTMVREFATLPGRKTVLLATTGLITTGDPDLFQALVERANKAGVTVYALDVVGLDETSPAQAGNIALGQVASVSSSQTRPSASASEARTKSRQGDSLENAIRNSDVQANLRALSEDTGGFMIANTHDFRKPFQKIVEEMDAHYEVSYRPKSDQYDGKLRKIEVKLARKDLSVESRTGYFAMPDLTPDLPGSATLMPYEIVGLAVLNVDPRPHAFDFRTGAYGFKGDPATAQTSVAFEIPGGSLSATPSDPAASHRVHFSLLSLVKDAGGQVVDKYSLDAPFDIPDANLAAIRASAVTYTHPIRVPPGRYTVETAVVDRESGKSSSNVMQIDAPPPAKGVGISSVILVQRVEEAGPQAAASDPFVFQGKRAVPMLSSSLTPAMKPMVYFVVYPDKANPEKPKILVEFLLNGQLAGKQLADLPAPDASGAIPMVIQAVLRPGKCELRVTAMQGENTSANSATYTVAAQ